MTSSDAVFSGAIPQLYDRHFGAAMFGPHAADLARRLGDLRGGVVLEVAAGTGIATAALLQALPKSVALVATDLNQAMLDVAAADGPGCSGSPGGRRMPRACPSPMPPSMRWPASSA